MIILNKTEKKNTVNDFILSKIDKKVHCSL